MIVRYILCKKCQSLYSPDYKACPVCGKKKNASAQPKPYKIATHVVCDNCGFMFPDDMDNCPACDTPVDSDNEQIEYDIIEQP